MLERLGLKEMRENGEYLLTPREGAHWMWRPEEDAAETVREWMEEEGVTVSQLVSALMFTVDRLDSEETIPPYALSWMCRDAVTRAVLQRFNEIIGSSCTNPVELSYHIGDNIAEANEVFRTIRFCDPVTGSGHFPVTLLNEMIALKSRLGILTDRNGDPLFQYKVVAAGQELVVFDKKRFDTCRLRASDPEGRRIRDTFLHEKQTLLASCLFGVDVDPTAVSVCRLRLWTELLKHLCPETDTSLAASVAACNVRCGDASVSRFSRQEDRRNDNPVFEQAVEWRREFPELWDETGDFVGFDSLIGCPSRMQNPPVSEAVSRYRQMNYKSYRRTGEAISLFCELGNRLLRQEGSLSCFTSKPVSADKIHPYLMEETNPLWVIEDTLSGKGIVVFQKARNQYRMMNCRIKEDYEPQKTALEDYLLQHATLFAAESRNEADAPVTFTVPSDTEKNIRDKIEQAGTPLGLWDIRMYPGIYTGCDEAFVIDGNLREEFIRADYKNTDIIKPLLRGRDVRRFMPEKTDLWLICIPWHFPLLYDATIKTASERAEQRFRQQYPAIYEHLEKFREKLVNRDAKEVGVTFEWYALQRYSATSEWDDFLTQKIVWQRESATADFCIDYLGCAILDKACFAAGQHLKYLLGVLNSRPGRYLLHDLPRLSGGERQIDIPALEALRIPLPNIKVETEVISWVNRRTSDAHQDESEAIDRKIDELVYEIFRLNEDEKECIESSILSY
ncbi:MAG: hypothetical protein LBL42_04650 [Tannerella sp.]|nr:hypothetical protein [Tannerella sp.]